MYCEMCVNLIDQGDLHQNVSDVVIESIKYLSLVYHQLFQIILFLYVYEMSCSHDGSYTLFSENV